MAKYLLLTLILCLPKLVLMRHLPLKGWGNEIMSWKKCLPCQEDRCPPEPQRCPAGKVRGHCGCCWECANVEGQMCDLPLQEESFGACGEGLQCQVKAGHSDEPQCVCINQESVCGTDRRTYKNLCRLQEAARTKKRLQLAVAHIGPCQEAPVFLGAPRAMLALNGQSIILGCEVSAQPLAEIAWRKEGTEGALPGESRHIIVQSRGGPQRHRVTGWLQIHRVRQRDAGVYVCHAWNVLGEISAPARLTVVPHDSPLAFEAADLHFGVFDVADDEEIYDDEDKSREGPSGDLP
ncbi:kazal-type serine protease inhibitor domain-containing protein 1-like [Bombina bombina]|uniref:kazal-type serine protease inhibitor domain-containing protein 1-like n=1 Tax=Bombina bombina TaxID=8345 RepID=UPI00235A5922|nr:kazal-type serine protease inhibitor domain-containing protein 1-like [Bombina bombina]